MWRDFFYSSVFYKSKFLIDFDFYFCKISSWTTGKAGNTAPRGQVPTPSPPDIPPERQGGPEQSGCGSRRGPTASQNEAHKGGERRRERPQQTGRSGTAGVSSRVTSVAGADGFSVKPTTKLEASNWFRFHTAAQRWAAGTKAETSRNTSKKNKRETP